MMYQRVLFVTAFLLGLNVRAQQVRVVEDAFGTRGEIRSAVPGTDSVLPRKGPLEIRWRELNGRALKTFRVKGQTQEHLPVGAWIWEEADWDYTVRVGDNIRPVFQAQGRREKWEGSFVNGLPDGKWNYTLDSLSAAGVSYGIQIRAELFYKNGKPSGAVSLENNRGGTSLKVKGSCDAQGFATGSWIYQYKTAGGLVVKEERVYKKGLLTEVRLTEGTNKSVVKLEHNLRFVEQAGEAALFEGKRIGEEHFEMDEYAGRAAEGLRDDLKRYFLGGWHLPVFPYEVARELPAFKKLEYPLSPEEKDDIRAARALIRTQRDSIDRQLSGNVYIHRSRSGELDTTIAFLQLNRERLHYIDSLLDRTDLPRFTYKNRYEQGVQHWISGLNALRTARGEVYDSLSVSLPLLSVAPDSLTIFGRLKQVLRQNETILPPYYHTVAKARLLLKREGELKTLEDLMLERFREVQVMYAEKAGVGGQIASKWVKGEVPHLLQEYARTDAYEEALHIGQQVMQRLDSLEAWQGRTEVFDKMAEVLKSQYTYMAYNPYTGAKDIAITIKKRFLQNVLTQLWPYTLAELEREKDWEHWASLWNQQFRVYHYLLNFASKDDAAARRLDRRVRKEKKPERMLRLILHQMDND